MYPVRIHLFIYKDNNYNYRIVTKLVSLKAIVLEETLENPTWEITRFRKIVNME